MIEITQDNIHYVLQEIEKHINTIHRMREAYDEELEVMRNEERED